LTAENNYLWWQRGVIYQIYPRSFKDSDGDGIGDLQGIIQKLDYISEILGVDAIWLSPFYPSPMADFGYDVSDYTNVHPDFGDLDIFDELIEQSHRRELKVIIDFVPNHSSDQHPWFIESSASKDNPRRDWYVWTDPKPDGAPSNNWLSLFGGGAWEWHPATGQYYLHSFLKEQPDLNWRNPELKEAMFDVLRFWMERGVDGFRVDVAHFIMKDPLLRDNPLKKVASSDLHKSLGAYDAQIHKYSQAHTDAHQVYREMRQVLDEYSGEHPRMAMGEIHIFDWEKWVAYYGRDLDELHMPLNFQLLGVAWKADSVRQVVDSQEQVLPPGAWPNYVLGNHDEMRIASKLNERQTRLAAMLLLTLRGTPTLYYGDEIGMQEVPIPPDQKQDPWGKGVEGLGRDGCRTPMQWDDSNLAGFCPPGTDQTWLPLGDNAQQVNVVKQLEEPQSLLNLYRTLITTRASSPALQVGSYTPVNNLPEDCYCFVREFDHKPTILVALNFSSQTTDLSFLGLGHGKILVSTYMDRAEDVDFSGLVLRGDEGLIIELEGGKLQ
jgi:alpha-glucosidase